MQFFSLHALYCFIARRIVALDNLTLHFLGRRLSARELGERLAQCLSLGAFRKLSLTSPIPHGIRIACVPAGSGVVLLPVFNGSERCLTTGDEALDSDLAPFRNNANDALKLNVRSERGLRNAQVFTRPGGLNAVVVDAG